MGVRNGAFRRLHRSALGVASGWGVLLAGAGIRPAEAVPAFAQQTGYACSQCHIGALGPQLTPFGRTFKMRGYSIRGGDQWYSKVPFAVWLQFGFEHYNKNEPNQAHYFNPNDNAYLGAVSTFLAGGFQTDSGLGFGAFFQNTYNNTTKTFANDNTDFKMTYQTDIFGKDSIIGVSVNNGPGVSDPWNDNGIWAYPYISPFLSLGGNASLALDGGVLQSNTWGVTGYTWFDQSIYAEAGIYNSESPWLLTHLGEGPGYPLGQNTGVEPYAQLDKAWFWGPNDAHIGLTYWHGNYNPNNPNSKAGSIDGFGHNSYTDLWLRHGYEFLGDNDLHELAQNGYFATEWQDLKSFTNAANPVYIGSSQRNNRLFHWRESVNYFYDNTYGFNVAFDKVWGTQNNALYNTGFSDGSGSAKGSPNTTYWLLEADWVPFGKEDHFWPLRPFINWRLGLQYYIYTQFNGSGHNYDGFGRNAADNNTLFLYLWTVF